MFQRFVNTIRIFVIQLLSFRPFDSYAKLKKFSYSSCISNKTVGWITFRKVKFPQNSLGFIQPFFINRVKIIINYKNRNKF